MRESISEYVSLELFLFLNWPPVELVPIKSWATRTSELKYEYRINA
jgi:hypothetical protein